MKKEGKKREGKKESKKEKEGRKERKEGKGGWWSAMAGVGRNPVAQAQAQANCGVQV